MKYKHMRIARCPFKVMLCLYDFPRYVYMIFWCRIMITVSVYPSTYAIL